jgi:hypothetical protein
LEIRPEHVAKIKVIGKHKGSKVIHLVTTGGFNVITIAKSQGKSETAGVGPHRAIALYIAKRNFPDIEYTELSKADFVPLQHYENLLPEYEALTQRFRSIK